MTDFEEQLLEWSKTQTELAELVREYDDHAFTADVVQTVAGFDVSYPKDESQPAVAAMVVCSLPDLQPVYSVAEKVLVTVPYVAGFLAFREIPSFSRLLRAAPVRPQVVILDGNGTLHCRGCGVASHFGVLEDIPAIGVSKSAYMIDGICKETVTALGRNTLFAGEAAELVGESGKVWGAALKMTENTTNPVVVSVGHRVSLETAVAVVRRCARFRVAEPVRLADKLSREELRKMEVDKDT